jgi:hypothetical protein
VVENLALNKKVEKPLIIRGSFDDVGDVVQIARAEGKRILHVDKVKVHPNIAPWGNDGWLVVVSV